MRSWLAVPLAASVALLLLACGGGAPAAAPTPTPPPPPTPTPAPREIKLVADRVGARRAFTPNSIAVQPGERIRVAVESKDNAEHSFTIEGLEAYVDFVVGAGKTAVQEITLPAGIEGTFTFYCRPHRAFNGTVGTITIGKETLQPRVEVAAYLGGPEMVIPMAVIDKPGWLQLHAERKGGGTDLTTNLGRVPLPPGIHRNVRIALAKPLTENQTLYAMLYYDDPADGQFTFVRGKPDDPQVLYKGDTVVKSFLVFLPPPPTPTPSR